MIGNDIDICRFSGINKLNQASNRRWLNRRSMLLQLLLLLLMTYTSERTFNHISQWSIMCGTRVSME